ncbi:alpha/beta hydrolase [Azospirillum sp. TSO22-1]|uniref:alpha/beta hydrolase n=1 Tax=Azospirillum sp. TSO22-1 TaxID=716789 RepID=UPI001FFFC086|nr:alpha/beta hydrolase [Azospirillum sp. TSO22-1]
MPAVSVLILRMLRLPALGLAGALLAAPPAAAQGRFTAAPCWFTPPPGESARCGTVAVPERRDRAAHRTLHLTVAVLRSTAQRAAPDPVLYIDGGPGASPFGLDDMVEERMEGWWELTAVLRRTRDVVLFDPRGVGRSEPDTDCAELDVLAGTPRTTAEERAALEACSTRLRAAGVDLGSFTTPAAADDVMDIAAALGAARVNLIAVSYGTRVALEILRRHGPRVRAAVLDGVYPPDINAEEEEAWLTHRALKRLFDDCTASRACRAAFPDLERRFLQLASDLNALPATVGAGDAPDPLGIRLDGSVLIAAVLEAMAGDEAIPRLPALIDRAVRGRPAPLAQYAPAPRLDDPDTAEGMAFSIECRETVNAADLVRTANNRRRWSVLPGLEGDDTGRRVCAVWPVGGQEPGERLPVASTAPVLLLSGAYDPVTPPEWGQRAAITLPQSRHVVFRAAGHGVLLGEPCALDLAAAFLDRPDVAKPPVCAPADRPPAFEVR